MYDSIKKYGSSRLLDCESHSESRHSVLAMQVPESHASSRHSLFMTQEDASQDDAARASSPALSNRDSMGSLSGVGELEEAELDSMCRTDMKQVSTHTVRQ